MTMTWVDRDPLEVLRRRLDDVAGRIAFPASHSAAVMRRHGHASAAASVAAVAAEAGEFARSWERSLADRIGILDDPVFHGFATDEVRGVRFSSWAVDEAVAMGTSGPGAIMDVAPVAQDLLVAVAARRAAGQRLAGSIDLPGAAPYQAAAGRLAAMERDLAESVVTELAMRRELVVALGGDAGIVEALDESIAFLTYELFLTRLPVPVDAGVVAGSVDSVRGLLDESRFGDVSGRELVAVGALLGCLSGPEVDAVVARLGDAELYRWHHEMDGVRGGNLDVDQEAALFAMLAAKASPETLWRLFNAEGGEKAVPIGEAIIANAPEPVLMAFAEMAARHPDDEICLLVTLGALDRLDLAGKTVLMVRLGETGDLDTFFAAYDRLLAEMDVALVPWSAGEFFGGLWDGAVVGLVETFRLVADLTVVGAWDRHTFRKRWSEMGGLATLLFADPEDFGELVLDMETLRRNPSRWLGLIAGDLLTGKGGAARRGIRSLARNGHLGRLAARLADSLDHLTLPGVTARYLTRAGLRNDFAYDFLRPADTAHPRVNRWRAKVNSIIESKLKPSDLEAYRIEARGGVVARKGDGTPYDHVAKVDQGLQGIVNITESLKQRLGYLDLSPAERVILRVDLRRYSRLLDEVERYLGIKRTSIKVGR